MADPAKLDAGAIIAHRIFHSPLNGILVAALLHVDEVNDHKPCKITQAELAGHLCGGFKIGFKRCFFDVTFAG